MEQYTQVFKTLSDQTRLRILRLLIDAGNELCVCELVDSLEEPQYNISKHIAAMRAAGLLKSRKEGRWVYCSTRDADGDFLKLLSRAVQAIPAGHVKRDRTELRKRLRLRKGGKCLIGVQKEHLPGKVTG
jgi:ArsR family transcriptional regulator